MRSTVHSTAKMRSKKFNFDFDKVYKNLNKTVQKINDDNKGSYHYLEITDRFHDVIEKSIKYFGEINTVDEDYFKSIFWKTWKLSKLQTYDSRGSKATEYKRMTRADIDNEGQQAFWGVSKQPDIDREDLIIKLDKFPHIKKIWEGYSVKELSKQAGISRVACYKRVNKELKKIML